MRRTRLLKTLKDEQEFVEAVDILLDECIRSKWVAADDWGSVYNRETIDCTSAYKTLNDLLAKLAIKK